MFNLLTIFCLLICGAAWAEPAPQVCLPNTGCFTLGAGLNDTVAALSVENMLTKRIDQTIGTKNGVLIYFTLPSDAFPCVNNSCEISLAFLNGALTTFIITNIKSLGTGLAYLEEWYGKTYYKTDGKLPGIQSYWYKGKSSSAILSVIDSSIPGYPGPRATFMLGFNRK